MLYVRICLGERMTVYLDVVFLENLVINFLIIYVTGIIAKAKISIFRILLGSAIGAIYSIIYYIIEMRIYSIFFIKIFLSIVIIYISFNPKNFKKILKQIIFFYLVSFVFGGSAISIIYMFDSKKITIRNGIIIESYTLNTI